MITFCKTLHQVGTTTYERKRASGLKYRENQKRRVILFLNTTISKDVQVFIPATSDAGNTPSRLHINPPADLCSHVFPSVIAVAQSDAYELEDDFLALNSDKEAENL